MIAYEQFIRGPDDHAAVVAVLCAYREHLAAQGDTRPLPQHVAAALANPDPRYVYAHAAAICGHHFVMLHAAEADCVALFRLRLEGVQELAFAFGGEQLPLAWFLAVVVHQRGEHVIRYLQPFVTDVNYAPNDANGCTALHWAVQGGHSASVEALLAYPGIDLEVTDRVGTTALARAFYSRHDGIADRLIRAGAKLRDALIIKVCQLHHAPSMTCMLAHCSDVDFVDKQSGLSPLHAAVAASDVTAVRMLLARGAQSDVRSRKQFKKSGRTYPGKLSATEFAQLCGDAEIEAALSARRS